VRAAPKVQRAVAQGSVVVVVGSPRVVVVAGGCVVGVVVVGVGGCVVGVVVGGRAIDTVWAIPLLVPSLPMTVSATIYVPACGNVCEIVGWVVSIVVFWGTCPGASLNCHTYSATPPLAVDPVASKLTVVSEPGDCVKMAVAALPFADQKSRH
jgi:hypothetical protein